MDVLSNDESSHISIQNKNLKLCSSPFKIRIGYF